MNAKRRWACLLFVCICGGALADEPDRPPASANAVFEVDFLENMIDHHAMAVQMAALCPSRATHAELLELCGSIGTSQAAEIQKMQGWLKGWYGIGHAPEMVEHDQVDLKHLASLSGAAFEQQFMQQMAAHHMVAVERAAECLLRTTHAALTEECDNIAESQARQIHQMRDWLCQWYSLCALHFMRSAMVGKPMPAGPLPGQ
jgi:hypothetical protein